jgi:hypothetical protein
MVSADLPVRRAASRTDISCVADTVIYYYYVYYYTASCGWLRSADVAAAEGGQARGDRATTARLSQSSGAP